MTEDEQARCRELLGAFATKWQVLNRVQWNYQFRGKTMVRYVDAVRLREDEIALILEYLSSSVCKDSITILDQSVGSDWSPIRAWIEASNKGVGNVAGVRLFHAIRIDGDQSADGPYVIENGCAYKVSIYYYWSQSDAPTTPECESGIERRIVNLSRDPETGLYSYAIEVRERVMQRIDLYKTSKDKNSSTYESVYVGVREEDVDSTGIFPDDAKVGEIITRKLTKNADCTKDVYCRKVVARSWIEKYDWTVGDSHHYVVKYGNQSEEFAGVEVDEHSVVSKSDSVNDFQLHDGSVEWTTSDSVTDGPFVLSDGCAYRVTRTNFLNMENPPETPESESGIERSIVGLSRDDKTQLYSYTIEERVRITQRIDLYETSEGKDSKVEEQYFIGVPESEVESTGLMPESGHGVVITRKLTKNPDCTKDIYCRKVTAKAWIERYNWAVGDTHHYIVKYGNQDEVSAGETPPEHSIVSKSDAVNDFGLHDGSVEWTAVDAVSDGPFVLVNGCAYKVTHTRYTNQENPPDTPVSESGIERSVTGLSRDERTGLYSYSVEERERITQRVDIYETSEDKNSKVEESVYIGVPESEVDSTGLFPESGNGVIITRKLTKNADCTKDIYCRRITPKAWIEKDDWKSGRNHHYTVKYKNQTLKHAGITPPSDADSISKEDSVNDFGLHDGTLGWTYGWSISKIVDEKFTSQHHYTYYFVRRHPRTGRDYHRTVTVYVTHIRGGAYSSFVDDMDDANPRRNTNGVIAVKLVGGPYADSSGNLVAEWRRLSCVIDGENSWVACTSDCKDKHGSSRTAYDVPIWDWSSEIKNELGTVSTTNANGLNAIAAAIQDRARS